MAFFKDNKIVTPWSETHLGVHEGRVYDQQYKEASLGRNLTLDFMMITGVRHPNILTFQITTGGGDIEISLYEDSVTSNDGTLILEAVDRNRNSASSPTAFFYRNPTYTDIGTSISELWIPPSSAGTGTRAVNFVTGGADEFIFKPNTKYTWRILNKGGKDIDVVLDTAWLETDTI